LYTYKQPPLTSATHIYHNLTYLSYNIKDQRFLIVRGITFKTEVGEEGESGGTPNP
jgi:hypothetical protein